MTMYLVEISYKEIRGSLNVVTRFMFSFGSLLVMCVGPFLPYDTLNYCLLALPLTYLVACWWIPESPYYYFKEGRFDNARKELSKLRKKDVEVSIFWVPYIQLKKHLQDSCSASLKRGSALFQLFLPLSGMLSTVIRFDELCW